MKKLISILFVFCLIFCTASPLTALAEDVNSDKGMYKIDDKIYADSYMLISLDDETYPVIAQKNKDKKKYPASLTKIATAMVTINNCTDLSVKVTVSKAAIDALAGTDAQVAGLKPGDELTVEQLLYLTMVHSACDACQVLAEYVAGSVPAFSKLMNDWAKSVGCTNTHFVNPDGLHDPEHYTTASDLKLMTLDALENETFEKIATTQLYEYNGYTFIHTNYMLDKYHTTYYYEYAEGIKTGSTSQAGYCVITKASKDGYNYLAIVLDSPIKKLDGYDTKCSFIDAKTMFNWAFSSLKYSTVIKANDIVGEVPVTDGKDADTVQLISETDVTTLVPINLDSSAVIIKPVNPPQSLSAPIKKGDYICDAEIIYGNKVITKAKLTASKDIQLSTVLKVYNGSKDFLGSKIVFGILLLMIFLLIIYIAVFISRANKAKKRSAERRRRREKLDEEINRNLKDTYRRSKDDIPPPRR